MACDNLASPRCSEQNDDETRAAPDAADLPGREYLCSWCFKRTERPYATHDFASGDADKIRKIFCSESCFGHYRRALFKQSSVCDWCKDTCAAGSTKTTGADSHGQQFNFCSDKCLVEYENSVAGASAGAGAGAGASQSSTERLSAHNKRVKSADESDRLGLNHSHSHSHSHNHNQNLNLSQNNFGGRLIQIAKNSLSSAAKCHLQKRPLRHPIAVKKNTNTSLKLSSPPPSITRHSDCLSADNKLNRPSVLSHTDRMSIAHPAPVTNASQHCTTAPSAASASSLSYAVDYLTTQAYYGYLQALFNQLGTRQQTSTDASLPLTTTIEPSASTNTVKSATSVTTAKDFAAYCSTVPAAVAAPNRPADGSFPSSVACSCSRANANRAANQITGEFPAPMSGCIPWLVPLPMPIPMPIPLAVPATWFKESKASSKDEKDNKASQSSESVDVDVQINDEPLNLCKWTK